VYITIEDVNATDTLADARHKRTNYEELVELLNQARGYSFHARASAYIVLKRRVNALLTPRLKSAQEASRAYTESAQPSDVILAKTADE
jgi:thermostable 8-oxoguanine DNA glycosylase